MGLILDEEKRQELHVIQQCSVIMIQTQVLNSS